MGKLDKQGEHTIINYEDYLPDNWIPIAIKANNTYNKRKAQHTHPLISKHHRICLDQENQCPAKRLGGCILSHCILRYPLETQHKHLK